jgi:uncharacterized tellurite resistance protein B-like protein
MTMASNIYLPSDPGASELLDLVSSPEDLRVAFYGSMFAMAAADGILGRAELDLIFETIDTDGLSEYAKNAIWDYMVEPPLLTDCIARFSTSSDQVRCTLMVCLIEIALADHILNASEEEALVQASRALHISQKQLRAIERFICDVGILRARPGDYRGIRASLPRAAAVLTALSIPATAVYFLNLAHRFKASELGSYTTIYGVALGIIFGVGATILICAAAFLTGHLLNTRSKRRRSTIAGERRQRAQCAVRNLQDAVGYLATKTSQLVPVGLPCESGTSTSAVFTERLRVLQQMLARRQSTASVVS